MKAANKLFRRGGEISQAKACYEEYDGIDLLERKVPVGSK
jgi:hypothetical protein